MKTQPTIEGHTDEKPGRLNMEKRVLSRQPATSCCALDPPAHRNCHRVAGAVHFVLDVACLLFLASGATPDLKPFAEASKALSTSVTTGGDLAIKPLARMPVWDGTKYVQPDDPQHPAKVLGASWEIRRKTMDAVLVYSASLAAINDAAAHRKENATELVSSVKQLASAVPTLGTGVSAAGDLVVFGLGTYVEIKAWHDMRKAVESADPAIQLVAKALKKDFAGLSNEFESKPNDLVFDGHGGFYFTDLGKRYARHRDHGGVYYALPDGSKIVELAFPLLSPNGCGLSPDGTMLYVADTEGARLWAFDVEAPGVLRAPEPFRPHSGRVIAGLPGNARFDSLAVMASGNIAVATLTTGSVTEFSPAGDLVREVTMPVCVSDQHLLWRPRYAYRVHHVIGHGPFGHDAVARARTAAELWLMLACCIIDPMYANLLCHWTRSLVVHGCSPWHNHAGSAQPYCPGVGPEHDSRRAPQVPIP